MGTEIRIFAYLGKPDSGCLFSSVLARLLSCLTTCGRFLTRFQFAFAVVLVSNPFQTEVLDLGRITGADWKF